MREKGNKLPAIDYAYSLGQYLSNVNQMSTLTILDLKNILHGLKNIDLAPNPSTSMDDLSGPMVGKHVAVINEQEDGSRIWVIGVIVTIYKNKCDVYPIWSV